MGREESELDSRYAVFPVPSRESKPNGPKGSWTPAGARQRDLVLSMQVEDEALGFLKDDSFTVEQFQETTVMGEKGIGSYWEKVMEDSDDPVSKPTKESRFKLWQVKKKKMDTVSYQCLCRISTDRSTQSFAPTSHLLLHSLALQGVLGTKSHLRWLWGRREWGLGRSYMKRLDGRKQRRKERNGREMKREGCVCVCVCANLNRLLHV